MAVTTGAVVPPGGVVLVTGVNGFIGSHIANALLNLGYAVRGSLRSEERGAWIKEVFAQRYPKVSFETALVPDVNAEGAWDNAVAGVQGVIHVAADMSFGADPNQVITPMVNGVRNLLQAAKKEKSIKRFVFTSSNRAALNPIPNEELTVHENLWNESAIASAWRPPPYEADRIWDVYAALKAQVEQEVWRYSKEESPSFVVNTILPDYVVGPVFHARQSGSTGKIVMDFWRDPTQYGFLKEFIPQWFVDVEDTALLHIAALTQEDVVGERLWGFAGTFNFNSWLEVFQKLDPKKPWPAHDPTQGHDLTKIDTSREVELLKRFGKEGWTNFYDSVRRNISETPSDWPA